MNRDIFPNNSLRILLVAMLITLLVACDGMAKTERKAGSAPKTSFGQAYGKAKQLKSNANDRHQELDAQAGAAEEDE